MEKEIKYKDYIVIVLSIVVLAWMLNTLGYCLFNPVNEPIGCNTRIPGLLDLLAGHSNCVMLKLIVLVEDLKVNMFMFFSFTYNLYQMDIITKLKHDKKSEL